MELREITHRGKTEEAQCYEYEDDGVSVSLSSSDSTSSVQTGMGFVCARVAQEYNLLHRQRYMYVTCIVVNVYGGSMVFRNIAFYRYLPGERLPQDIGFEILPAVKGWFTAMPMFLLQLSCLGMCVASFFPRSVPGPFATNIIRRWGVVVCMGTVLRFITYTSTTLPGAADHCVPSRNVHIQRDQPKTMYDIFFMLKVDGIGIEENTSASGTYNCGDLVFSGHMLMTISYAFTLLRYAPEVFLLSRVSTCYFGVLVWMLAFVQGLTIIMARNHYTMDVVIASYVTPLLWHWYITALDPEDMRPDAY